MAYDPNVPKTMKHQTTETTEQQLQQRHPPFRVSPEELKEIIVPYKDRAKLDELGGAFALLDALCVDAEYGLYSVIGGATDLNIDNDGAKNMEGSKPEIDLSISKLIPGEIRIGISSKPAVPILIRQQVFGSNVLPAVKPKTLIQFMLKALSDKIMIILSIAAIASLATGLYEDFNPNQSGGRIHWIEGFSIVIAVLVVVFASSLNDLQKESQFRKLNAKKEDRKVKCFRDAKIQLISIYDIVVGDILLVEPGDVVAVDGVLISGTGIKCDESSATGESDAVKKSGDKDPFFVSGSKVLEGAGRYLVTGVGERSFFGTTMMALRTEAEDTPLQVKLDALAELIAKFGASAAIIMLLVLILKYVIIVSRTRGFGDQESQESGSEIVSQIVKIIISCITIVVVAVPEGLPLAVTLALAYATTRMLKDNNLVRVLSACETMGNATTICSDKTGTLTQNKMTVVAGVVGKNVFFEGAEDTKNLRVRIASLPRTDASTPGVPIVGAQTKIAGPAGPDLLGCVLEGIAYNSSAFDSKDEQTGVTSLIGSKTEVALLEFTTSCGFDYSSLRHSSHITVVQVYPFSSERKSMSTILRIQKPGQKPLYRVHVKGASEIVLRNCSYFALLPFSDSPSSSTRQSIPIAGSRSNPKGPVVTPIDVDGKPYKDYEAMIDKYAAISLRTICLAFREFSEEEFYKRVRGELKELVVESRKKDTNDRRNQEKLAKDDLNSGIIRDDFQVRPITLTGDPITPSTPHISDQRDGGHEGLLAPGSHNFDASSYVSQGGISLVDDDCNPSDDSIISDPIACDYFVKSLICTALVGIEDPLRPGVTEAVRSCQMAGVTVRMVTGDNVLTAKSIAAQCGIINRDSPMPQLVMEGAFFRKLPRDEMIKMIPHLRVLARSSPTDKQILVSILKDIGETVAVTGDGTNDGPALKSADVGFSMGIAGTEVAKEASSIVLMDDSFSSVVKAIVWGRHVNDSVKKFLQFQLSVNISAVFVTFISAVSDSEEGSVLTAVQLLWVNLIMDTLGALALSTEKPVPDILLNRPPDNRRNPLISFKMWKMIIGQAILQIAIQMILLFSGPSLFGFKDLEASGGIMGTGGTSPQAAKDQKRILETIIFNSFVLLQIFNLVNCRKLGSHINVIDKLWENSMFMIIFLIIFIGQVIIIQFGGVAFNTIPLSGKFWGLCIVIGFMSLPWGLVMRLLPLECFWGPKECGGVPEIGFFSSPAAIEQLSPVKESLHSVQISVSKLPEKDAANSPQFITMPTVLSKTTGLASSDPVIFPHSKTTKTRHEIMASLAPPILTGSHNSSIARGISHVELSTNSQSARVQWQHAIQAVRNQQSVYAALRGDARRRRADSISLKSAGTG